ncbi:MAG: MFS transporter [Austwickia sp.]|nr:MFS transporter [Austwickia sp.]
MSVVSADRTTGGSARPSLLSKQVLVWAAYDWGGAAFNAVITTFVFTVYLTGSAFGDRDTTDQALALGLGVAGVIIAVLAPVTGQRADRGGRATFWLGVYSTVVLLVSYALYFVRPDPAYLWLGVGLLGVGQIFQELAAVNYNALLNRISTPATIGRVSALGWGAGYVGGILLLLILYVGFIAPEVGWFGVTKADGLNVRVSMLVAATWFGVSMVPLLVVMRRRRHQVVDGPGGTAQEPGADPDFAGPPLRPATIAAAYRRLWRTIAALRREHPDTLRFLLASAVFRDGLAGIFTFGSVVAVGSYGFSPATALIFGIVANVVAGVATVASGWFDDRLGPKRVMVTSLIAMIVAGTAVFALQGRGPVVFWTVGLVLVAFVGPVQSASRSFLARVIPEGRDGEIFCLYTTTGRAVSFLAPWMFGLFIDLGRRVVGPGGNAQPWGIAGLMLILLVGLVLLLPVRAVRAAPGRSEHLVTSHAAGDA